MLLRFFSWACVAAGLGFGGYTTSNQLPATQYPPTHWVLSTLDGKPLPYLQPAARPELVLPSPAITKEAHYQGAFEHSISTRLQAIPRIISTMMRRSNQAIEVEMRYLSVLEQTTRFEISGNTLQLYAAKQATPLATFRAADSAL
ncbi:META domain-containing protein [Hymenobacter radiodurans]|uniref:META domain-containing protein n=1 Tax=Hymenobacter radiodurans TaxID=2496028 RepID=UPI001058538D|nr:META domain-containing protein [Hymenobacter radiodurans]